MKNHLFYRALAALLVCTAVIICLAACQNKSPAPASGTKARSTTPETMVMVNVDYHPFIIHGGSMYEIADETVSRAMIGKKLGEITGNPPNCCTEEEYRRRSLLSYEEREGEASFLTPGTPFYAVSGDDDLIVADSSGRLEVYRRYGTTAPARDILAGSTVTRTGFKGSDNYTGQDLDIPLTPLYSAAELEAFLVEWLVNEYAVEEVMSIQKYDSAFFAEYALIPVAITFSPSGSIKYEVVSAMHDGDRLTVVVSKTIPEVGTCDIAEWLLLAEVKKSDITDVKSFGMKLNTIELARESR